MSLNYEQLVFLRKLNKDLDSLVETLQINHSDLANAIFRIYEFLNKEIQVEIMFVETQDENMNNRVFCYGKADENIKRRTPQLIKIEQANSFNTPGMAWYVQPLDMAGTQIGSIGLAFSADNPMDKEVGAEVLDCVSEELDNFFFGIHSNRLKHSIIMGIQSALKNHSIIDSIDGAAYVLKKEIPFEKMIIIYSDRELTGLEHYNYLIYNGIERANDSFNAPHQGMEAFLKNNENPLSANTDDLKGILDTGTITVSYLLDGLIEEELIGKVILIPEEGAEFSVFAHEIIQIFTETLRQRLVDFNRERNSLRKFFSDKVINQLTSELGYDKNYLAAREEEIGIIFADISGFTKMSEQILKTPEKITKLVDSWSNGILAQVFPLGGCLDKLVGDCIILLFGPPFYNDSPETIVEKTLKAAEIIVNFTGEFLRSPENEAIQKHEDFDKFGVALGVNFCPSVVGLIGPNDDLTAFSSGMNLTARLQGLANAGEVLVTEKTHEIATKIGKWEFEDQNSAPVKNVAKPLVFYKLKIKNEK